MKEMSFKSAVKGRGSDRIDGDNEDDDNDKVICAGCGEPGGE